MCKLIIFIGKCMHIYFVGLGESCRGIGTGFCGKWDKERIYKLNENLSCKKCFKKGKKDIYYDLNELCLDHINGDCNKYNCALKHIDINILMVVYIKENFKNNKDLLNKNINDNEIIEDEKNINNYETEDESI